MHNFPYKCHFYRKKSTFDDSLRNLWVSFVCVFFQMLYAPDETIYRFFKLIRLCILQKDKMSSTMVLLVPLSDTILWNHKVETQFLIGSRSFHLIQCFTLSTFFSEKRRLNIAFIKNAHWEDVRVQNCRHKPIEVYMIWKQRSIGSMLSTTSVFVPPYVSNSRSNEVIKLKNFIYLFYRQLLEKYLKNTINN